MKTLLLCVLMVALASGQVMRIPTADLTSFNVEVEPTLIPQLNIDRTVLQPDLEVVELPEKKESTPYDWSDLDSGLGKTSGLLYEGEILVKITDGEQSNMNFHVVLAQNPGNCSWRHCYYGWVADYQIDGEEKVSGYPNRELPEQPVFGFNTNSDQDYEIVKSESLDETWSQIIQVFCEKVNPSIVENSSLNEKRFAESAEKSNDEERGEFDIIAEEPKYVFQTVQAQSSIQYSTVRAPTASTLSRTTTAGYQEREATVILNVKPTLIRSSLIQSNDRFSSVKKAVKIDDLETTKSNVEEEILLSSENLIKQRITKYSLGLSIGDEQDIRRETSNNERTESGEPITPFDGNIWIELELLEKIRLLVDEVRRVGIYLSKLQVEYPERQTVYTANRINLQRDNLALNLNLQEQALIRDLGLSVETPEAAQSQPGDEDSVQFGNEQYSGVNVVEEFEKAKPKPGGIGSLSGLDFKVETNNDIYQGGNDAQVDFGQVFSAESDKRILQVLKNYTIYSYKKTLFSKSILGKSFKAQVEVKCYLLVLPFDHQVQCTGKVIYILFGKTRTINIFNFKKSVSFSWSWSKQYKGQWGFNVWVGLPKPVNFIGISFSFKVNYVIDLSLTANTIPGLNPFKFKVRALATTQVNTDAKASLKVLALIGGVFIRGTLVKAGTDPTLTLSYYFTKQQIKVLAQWYFWIYAFQYKWGFFYRYWRLFKGWSGEKIIKQWTIKGVYKKYAIINKSWTISV